jgi:UDP-GlcNAc:undecaprenyl-phosphate GlcNAc-1-phosphate transferase
MDGLSAGIAAIGAFSLAVSFGANNQPDELLFVAAFIGALVGFLVYNFNPASIFMGDCGSLFVGFLLSSSVLLNQTGGRSRSVFSILAVPVLILFVPIFDTTFVTFCVNVGQESLAGRARPYFASPCRTRAFGTFRRFMLYAFAVVAGALSLLVSQLQTTQSFALLAVFVVFLTIIGVYLSKVKVYEEQDEELALKNNVVFGFLVNISYNAVFLSFARRHFDYAFVYASYLLLFGPIEESADWDLFLKSLPILLVFKLSAFLVVGVYRGLWRYTSIGDFINTQKPSS